MKNFFEFVKLKSNEKGITFKEALTNKSIRDEWKSLRKQTNDAKREAKRNEAKQLARNILRSAPKQNEIITQTTSSPSDDPFKNAKVIPKIDSVVIRDEILDIYNKRYSDFINSLGQISQRFIDLYPAINKRPEKINLPNFQKLKPYLIDTKIILQDSPFLYDVNAYVFNPRVMFNGKREIIIKNVDPSLVCSYFPAIYDPRSQLVNYNYNTFNRRSNILVDHVTELNNKFSPIQRNELDTIYINDMVYDKTELYARIFIYGMFLTMKTPSNDKKIIVATSFNIGDKVTDFYKSIDTGFFARSANFDFGVPDIADFDFQSIVDYISGKSIITTNTNPVINPVTNPVTTNPVTKPDPETKPDTESDDIDLNQVDLGTITVEATAVDIITTPGRKEQITFSHFSNIQVIPPGQEAEMNKKIYFRLSDMYTVGTDSLNSLKQFDFVYFQPGFISQIVNITPQTLSLTIIDNKKNFGMVTNFRVGITSNERRIYKVEFIKPDKVKGQRKVTRVFSTTLRNIALLNIKNAYQNFLDKYKEFLSDETDFSNSRYDFAEKLSLNSSVNPSSISGGAIGDPINQESLAKWLSMFNLKAVNSIGDYSNGQNLYTLHF